MVVKYVPTVCAVFTWRQNTHEVIYSVLLWFLPSFVIHPEIKASDVKKSALKPNLRGFYFRTEKRNWGTPKKHTVHTGQARTQVSYRWRKFVGGA